MAGSNDFLRGQPIFQLPMSEKILIRRIQYKPFEKSITHVRIGILIALY